MTDTKHTPGPWLVVSDESAAQVTGYPCIHAADYTVVGIEGMFGHIGTDFANAHLIAAAPDLLDALEQSTKEWVELAMSGDCGNWDVDQMSVVTNARAAIAKAKGEPT